MPEVTILLCGPPRLLWRDQPLSIERRKALALAAYLALAELPTARDELAAMLWPELSQERARGALRATLPALRTAAPVAWISADRRSLSLSRAAVTVDARRFTALVAVVRAHHLDGSTVCPDCAEQLRAADALYRGDLLQGFSLPQNPDFEAWQLAQREALRRELGWALQALALHHERYSPQAAETALVYSRRWLELDPLNEAAHRLLMSLYAADGRRSEALRQYQSCVALLGAELGVAPQAETTELFERVARDELAPSLVRPAAIRPGPARRSNLPAAPDGFVGRETELAWLLDRFDDPACRLVTITGPGGSGKTRLALQAATALASRFADGARQVALDEALTLPEAINLTAAALGANTAGAQPLEALRVAASQRELLLLLDNLEQVAEGAELPLALLAAGPRIKLLVTSRERLALRAEHVLPLAGLSYPGPAAIKLFVQRARQVRPDFALTPENQTIVGQICAFMEGLPLGIELAATWARSLSPAEILAALEHSPDLLQTSVRDLPARHRSMRAAFDHAWRLLSPSRQATFRRLAVFRGGFSAEAARSVVGASLADLADLQDCSLLQRSAEGRYALHPLLLPYAAERLAETPDDERLLRVAHCRFMSELAARLAQGLCGDEQPAALSAMAREEPNLRAAWAWALEAADLAALALMLDGLAHFCELRNDLEEGAAALAAAEARLAALPAGETTHLLARIRAWRGHFCRFLGRYAESEAALAQALATAEAIGDEALRAFCLCYTFPARRARDIGI